MTQLTAPVRAEAPMAREESERAPDADPRIDRAVIAPTGWTAAPGTLTFSAEDLLLLGASYVLPEATEISGRLLLPVITDVSAGVVMAKHPVLTRRWLRLAALAGYTGIGTRDFDAFFLGGGLAGALCFNHDCQSLVSIWGALGWGRNFSKERDRVTASEAVVTFGPSLLVALGRHFKLVAEVDATTADLTSVLVMGALRVHGRAWACDLGAAWLDNSVAPLLTLTWRPDLSRASRPGAAPAYILPALPPALPPALRR
jgi:hypothetical protein